MPFTGNSSDSSDGEDDLTVSRDQSEIDDEDDYALPPDARMECLTPRSRSRTRASCLESPRKTAEKTLEKSGYLTKLGGKIKSWNRRYFVLSNGVLSYWKSQVDKFNFNHFKNSSSINIFINNNICSMKCQESLKE